LRIDKVRCIEYNKTRTTASTAEDRMRSHPADFKRKERRPMVDLEPAQCGQAVGNR
jgi:hypothetical protein